MKKLVLIFFLININLSAQFKITFTDHSITDDGDIILTVFAQNLGNNQEIWAVYGQNFYDRFEEMQTNYYLSYIDIMNDNKIRERIPSSIVIKTIFNTYISMSTPTYYFGSTGGNAGEEWVITFMDIPEDAGSVTVEILGSEFNVGDMPKADETRKRKEKLLSDAIDRALETSNAKRWNEAASNWENAMQLNFNIIHKYSDKITTSFLEKGKLLFKQNNFPAAINYFEKGKEIDKRVFENYSDEYSNLQYTYGEKLLNASEINDGVKSLKYSYSLSTINRTKIETKLDEMKRSQFTSISLSLIPGLSQLVFQKNTTKSLLLFGAFGVSSVLTLTNKIKADNYYDDYLKATTPQDAKAKYELADQQIKKAGLYLGLVIATVVYSIVDQYVETSSYNSLFEITPNLISPHYGQNHYAFTLSIKIPF